MTELDIIFLDPNAPPGSMPTADDQGGVSWKGSALSIPPWAPNEDYPAGFVVQQSGALYARTTQGTSAADWPTDQANWTQVL